MATESLSTVKNCPKCKDSFICNAAGCWCCELPQFMPLHPDAECYCPQCLVDALVEKMDHMNYIS